MLLETKGTRRIGKVSVRLGGVLWDSEVTLLGSLTALPGLFLGPYNELLWDVLLQVIVFSSFVYVSYLHPLPPNYAMSQDILCLYFETMTPKRKIFPF